MGHGWKITGDWEKIEVDKERNLYPPHIKSPSTFQSLWRLCTILLIIGERTMSWRLRVVYSILAAVGSPAIDVELA